MFPPAAPETVWPGLMSTGQCRGQRKTGCLGALCLRDKVCKHDPTNCNTTGMPCSNDKCPCQLSPSALKENGVGITDLCPCGHAFHVHGDGVQTAAPSTPGPVKPAILQKCGMLCAQCECQCMQTTCFHRLAGCSLLPHPVHVWTFHCLGRNI